MSVRESLTIFGESKPTAKDWVQEPVRKAPPSFLEPSVMTAAPPSPKAEVRVMLPSTVPPRSMHDVRVEALRRGVEGALRALQEVAELEVLDKLLEDQNWSASVKEDMIKAVDRPQ